MAANPSTAVWLRRVNLADRPIYRAILRALESAVRDGVLNPGDQLPAQRAVASHLGIDFTTVTRAYGVARARGLVEGAAGRGTFVSRGARDLDAGLVDLSMNLPPQPHGLSLARLLRETTATILERTEVSALMAYQAGAGSPAQKAAGAAWIAPCAGEIPLERMLVCAGAQTALAAVLSTLTRPGDTIVAEALTYPGLLAVTSALGLRLLSCPCDDQGLIPEALAELCAHGPRAIYCVPTLHNPTTATMGLERRREIAGIAAAASVPFIEDDAYGRLPAEPWPSLCSLSPGGGYYLSTLSKCLSPGLRIAFVAAPDPTAAQRVAQALRSLSLMAAPMMSAVAAAWIRDGVADDVLEGIRVEARERRRIAAEILPQARGGAESLHVWVDLPKHLDIGAIRDGVRERGLALVTSEAFASSEDAPSGVRISLGAPSTRMVLTGALKSLAGILGDTPPAARLVV